MGYAQLRVKISYIFEQNQCDDCLVALLNKIAQFYLLYVIYINK